MMVLSLFTVDFSTKHFLAYSPFHCLLDDSRNFVYALITRLTLYPMLYFQIIYLSLVLDNIFLELMKFSISI